jgi:hypothetical protein
MSHGWRMMHSSPVQGHEKEEWLECSCGFFSSNANRYDT